MELRKLHTMNRYTLTFNFEKTEYSCGFEIVNGGLPIQIHCDNLTPTYGSIDHNPMFELKNGYIVPFNSDLEYEAFFQVFTKALQDECSKIAPEVFK